jgi:hypothetical protein
MAGLQERFRGQVSIGGVISNQVAALSSSPLFAPTISFSGQSDTAAAAPQFVLTITMNRHAFGDTDGAVLARRAVMGYHWETTAGARLDGATLTGAVAGNTSGLTAVGVVLPSSTASGGFMFGKIVCSSTGVCTAAFTATSGGGTTGVLILTLPNGLIASSTQINFTS